jgi:hypothetical protein
MTLSDLRAAWLRWMHRKDLEADLDTVQELTLARITQRLMYPAPEAGWDIDELVEAMPTVWHHGGLCSLHELAQDDEGLGREAQLFESAITDWHFRNSIDQGPARPNNPWTEARRANDGRLLPRRGGWV